MAYSDKAPQFDSAFTEMRVALDHSLPGRAQTNSLAERNNQFILTTITACLLQAGLPPCFWRKAIECVCHLLNVEPGDDDLSAWCKMHGKDFGGEKIPFGALVFFKPLVVPEQLIRMTSLIRKPSQVSSLDTILDQEITGIVSVDVGNLQISPNRISAMTHRDPPKRWRDHISQRKLSCISQSHFR